MLRGFFLVWLLSLCMLGGCMDRKSGQLKLTVIESSHKRAPKWISQERYESKHYFYFMRFLKAELNSPQFAYALARKELHAFLKEEAEVILASVEEGALETTHNQLVTEFVVFLSKNLMKKIRQEDSVYWEKVNEEQFGYKQIKYRYYVLLRLNKKDLIRFQRQFLYKKMDKAEKLGRRLLRSKVKRAIDNLNKKIKADQNKQESLQDDFEFES